MDRDSKGQLDRSPETVGFVGAGNMAGALVRGLVAAGLPPHRIVISDLDETKVGVLVAETGARRAESAAEVARDASVVILAVKPGAMSPVLESVKEAAHPLWISVAAGVSTARLEAVLNAGARVVRAMPNTPALVRSGATAICGGTHATEEDLSLAELLLGATGLVVRVPEAQMNAVTGLSGSGPAYVMLVIEALADGGVRAGLPRDVALALATQTVLGSATLLKETGLHPGELKDSVTSPGGTTIAGIEELELRGVRGALMSAVARATERARELGGD